jgi:hypothetical protein
LTEQGVRAQRPEVIGFNASPWFFKSPGALPFDPFSAAFYLVTRYEEYLPHDKDLHQRFPAKAGIAKQHGFLQIPIINRWAETVRTLLMTRFPLLTCEEPHYRFTPTYDVDMAWAYRHKGFVRNMGGYLQALVKGRFSDLRKRTTALLGGRDPYDSFDFIDGLTSRFGLQPLWFFHIGQHGPFDKSIRASHPQMTKLIRRIASRAPVGMHPSYGSNTHLERVAKEKRQLETIVGQPITRSRQHFLVMSMPDTYRRLIDLGITDEYSMGYSSDLGFRAGTCSPFFFYDLQREEQTPLRVHPFAIMDATMQYFDVRVKAADAPAFVEQIVNEVKRAKGPLMTLFHNNSFSEQDEWIGWRTAYERILELCQP